MINLISLYYIHNDSLYSFRDEVGYNNIMVTFKKVLHNKNKLGIYDHCLILKMLQKESPASDPNFILPNKVFRSCYSI